LRPDSYHFVPLRPTIIPSSIENVNGVPSSSPYSKNMMNFLYNYAHVTSQTNLTYNKMKSDLDYIKKKKKKNPSGKKKEEDKSKRRSQKLKRKTFLVALAKGLRMRMFSNKRQRRSLYLRVNETYVNQYLLKKK
jgi:hypothetical protein